MQDEGSKIKIYHLNRNFCTDSIPFILLHLIKSIIYILIDAKFLKAP